MDKKRLRRVNIQDMELIYEWANEEAVRKNSINTDRIEFEDHKKWFYEKISSSESDMFIYLFQDKPVGQIRIDYNERCGWISFSIDKQYRGQGHGRAMLRLAEQEVRKNRPEIIKLSGIVKKNNIPSRRKFEELQYVINEEHKDKAVILYEKIFSKENYTGSE